MSSAHGQDSGDSAVLTHEAREPSDVQLVAACRKGDASAFDALMRRHKDRIYNLAYRYLGNREDALDLAQEVFVKAYRNLDGFRGEAQVYTWLHAIALNLARNRTRDGARKGRNKSVSLDALTEAGAYDGASPGPSPSAEAMGHELEDVLQECLNELPDHYRLAFVLRTVEGMSYDEIAQALSCPKGTVKSRLNQARLLLRSRLEERSLL